MVGPLGDEQRHRGYRGVKVGIVALVGVSSGLVALTGDPSPVELGVVVAAGLATGIVLLLVLGA